MRWSVTVTSAGTGYFPVVVLVLGAVFGATALLVAAVSGRRRSGVRTIP
jgi:hypothetical protein